MTCRVFVHSSLSGCSLGILMGLSASPVLQLVIPTLLTFLVALVPIMEFYNKKKKVKENDSVENYNENKQNENDKTTNTDNNKKSISFYNITSPIIASLFVSVVVGSFFGIFIRNNNCLGIKPEIINARWNYQDDSIMKANIYKTLFYKKYGIISPGVVSPKENFNTTTLNNLLSDDCTTYHKYIKNEDYINLKLDLKESDYSLKAKKCGDNNKCLDSLINVICPN